MTKPATPRSALNGGVSTRDRMLQNAASLFRQRGYAGATTRELASTMGMQSASLYHHMGKKEDLLVDLCVHAIDNITRQMGEAVQEPPATRVRAMIRAHVRAALEDQDAHAVMLIELRMLASEQRARVIALRDTYEALIDAALTECQAAGALRSDVPARQLRLALLNSLNWSIFWWRHDGELSVDGLADLLATLYLEGAASPQSGSAT